ncbi:hypothetical protein T492DRAFT_1145932 [Pavlovales sp. CCMP2436]|nr:hypothetical protein T492DRAFT_1145932 [Pavlovales sp. CCMP2436]
MYSEYTLVWLFVGDRTGISPILSRISVPAALAPTEQVRPLSIVDMRATPNFKFCNEWEDRMIIGSYNGTYFNCAPVRDPPAAGASALSASTAGLETHRGGGGGGGAERADLVEGLLDERQQVHRTPARRVDGAVDGALHGALARRAGGAQGGSGDERRGGRESNASAAETVGGGEGQLRGGDGGCHMLNSNNEGGWGGGVTCITQGIQKLAWAVSLPNPASTGKAQYSMVL